MPILLDRWQLSLAQDAPNRFIINVQSDQVQPVRDFIAAQGLAAPTLVPMVRARLLERNGKPVRGDAVADRVEAEGGDARQARRRAEREFNLSFAAALRDDNKVVDGKFWGKTVPAQPELSSAGDFAPSPGWGLGREEGGRVGEGGGNRG